MPRYDYACECGDFEASAPVEARDLVACAECGNVARRKLGNVTAITWA